MAVSRKTKIFEINDKKYRFDKDSLNFLFNKYCQKNKIKKEEFEFELSEQLNISQNSIHNWRNGLNGPSGLEMIKTAAIILDVDYFKLLKEEKEVEINKVDNVKKLKGYTDLQLISIKKIYDQIILFLDEFRNTGGFTTTLWYEYSDKGYKDPESAIYDYVEGKLEIINLVIEQEYFYLHDLPIYEEIIEYYCNDLYDIFNGKLGYAYRFEAYAEGNPTTDDDYSKALERLNSIIINCVKTK